LDFLHELGRFLEPAIHARETHVGDLVDRFQTLHHAFADRHRRNFPVKFVCDFVLNFVRELLERFRLYGPFLAGGAEAQEEFEAKYAKRGLLRKKNGLWVRRRLVDYVRHEVSEALKRGEEIA
jgi:hypothetical protein